MIAPQELRIGNWVMTKQGTPVQVLLYFDKSIRNEIYTTSNTDLKYEEDDCDGIPLTPEILEKCGFLVEKRYGLWMGAPKEHGLTGYACFFGEYPLKLYIHIDTGHDRIVPVLKSSMLETIELTPIHALHQLQNLCFSLTGKELVYEP